MRAISLGPWLAAVAFSALLLGCDFHLRGVTNLPPGTHAIYVRAPNLQLRDELELYLVDAGAVLSPTAKDADAVLYVGPEAIDDRTLSVDPRTGKEREFEVTYVLQFHLKNADGTMMVERQQIVLRRDFVFDPDQVIGKSRERGVLHEEMRRDAAQQILARMDAALEQ